MPIILLAYTCKHHRVISTRNRNFCETDISFQKQGLDAHKMHALTHTHSIHAFHHVLAKYSFHTLVEHSFVHDIRI